MVRFSPCPFLTLNSSRSVLFPSTVTATSSMFTTSSSSSSHQDSTDLQMDRTNQVLKYHDQTKHSLTKYSRGPHGLDWENQPNPFRRFISAPIVPLIHFPIDSPNPDSISYSSVFNSLPSPKPISISTISQFFYDSLALSAWKTTGYSTWSLRVNPSSGNLHPTEAYIISPPIESISNSPFVAHYAPKDHSLEIRADIPSNFFPKFFPQGSFLIGISSIFWREAWKYGERAFRYCNHDVGHAVAALSMAAAGLGWEVKMLDELGYDELEKLMGLETYPKFKIPSSRPVKGKFPDIEFEHPDCVLLVYPNGVDDFNVDYEEFNNVIMSFSKLEWKGEHNLLSKEHVCWDIIYRTAEATKKPLELENRFDFTVDPFHPSGLISECLYKNSVLREVIRNRRSAVDMDEHTEISRETFYQIILHCVPSGHQPEEVHKKSKQLSLPFRSLPWDPQVHAVLFVHRVSGLPKGLYFLVRNDDHLEDLKRATKSEFKWEKPEGCPDGVSLFELAKGDFMDISKRLSCHQEIASDGCFSLGMVARFEPILREKGAWMYPRLFWETGVLGQVLYLEAHAVGISATGIGCFFDDSVHEEVLGLRGSNYQSLYHFTVGGAVNDNRIMSLPAYPGPSNSRW
ncbi:uncharacterized protein LOC124919453 [Impatiens glandulifera]|uniref:uncharacterized protein LOC124919453 n=1 Tax=Impatiens glandulifera TaxID=253017 RepID=UPI001FB165C8|nr:uncharacterized protein LOC124919453 [Impatiens glandulifera]